MSLESDLRTAFETRLFTVTGFPDADHRALENVTYEPVALESWARVTHAWGGEEPITMPGQGAWMEYRGLMTVNLFAPVDESPSELDTLARAVVDKFPYGLSLTVSGKQVHVTRSRRWTGERDGGWHHVPVDVAWRMLRTNVIT